MRYRQSASKPVSATSAETGLEDGMPSSTKEKVKPCVIGDVMMVMMHDACCDGVMAKYVCDANDHENDLWRGNIHFY